MENEHVVVHIMTDIKGSNSNLGANFQNAIAVPLLPPIGVFWDIENIHVPKGKSGSALVSAIRERFFKHYREAEFMCVCDINKEIKSIIHELNDAQVTVVHVDATSKNAADEKLKQCMRRFVDTHGFPSTLILISDDVNFASDLSDFRHRHHIHIILLHRQYVPDALLACAHEHYNFSEVTMDLPMRSPQKVLNNRPRDIIVTDLPPYQPASCIKKCLRRLSENCGGKVVRVTKSKAIISFASADSAERAQKRMDNQLVYGQKVTVNFLHPDSKDFTEHILRRNLYKDNNLRGEPSCSSPSASSRDSSPHCSKKAPQDRPSKMTDKTFAFPAAPILNTENMPNILKSPHKLRRVSKNSNSTQVIGASNAVLQPLSAQVQGLANFPSSTASKPWENLDSYLHQDYLKVPNLTCQENISPGSHFVPLGNQMKYQIPESSQSNPGAMLRTMNSSAESFGYESAIRACSGITQSLNSFVRANESASSLVYKCNSQRSRSESIVGREGSSPVELYVTNLDQTVEINEMKKIISCIFREHVMVLHISMLLQPDGNAKAVVKVPTMQDAQYAISQLQRKKVGHRRILILHVGNDRGPPFSVLKSEVVSLLKDIPSKQLPLFKFREMYEKRYNRAISMSDMYKMRDVISVLEDASGRMVCLSMDYRTCTPSPVDTGSVHSQELAVLEKPYCERHFHLSESEGWAEQQGMAPLPDVVASLKSLSLAVHTLLDSHQGSLPLNSFCACYESDIGPLQIVAEGADVPQQYIGLCVFTAGSSTNRGIPLEHLISCIAGVEIVISRHCIKNVQWCENGSVNLQAIRSISPALMGPLAVFGREMMDLLKNQSRCIVPFNKFIPVYHHHFGRQCRVADYGFTKLIDLLEAIPHILQVLGEGQNRLVTLTHRMQVKRFTADLLRILKARASKQMEISELPVLYQQTTEKVFEVTNYGICRIEDMLAEVSESSIIVTQGEEDTIIAIPKREQTREEMERTKVFSSDVIELLKHTPTCSMPFNKFIPAYHHHFGKQCRVSDYGFSKLIELFEAIPFIEVSGTGEDKILNLAMKERDEILVERLVAILQQQPDKMISVDMIGPAYTQTHGHALRPEEFGASGLTELLKKFDRSFKVIKGYSAHIIALVDSEFIRQTCSKIIRLLMEQKEGRLTVPELNLLYKVRFGLCIRINVFQPELTPAVKFIAGLAELNELHLLARDLILLLQELTSPVPCSELAGLYLDFFGLNLQPALYDFSDVTSLLLSLKNFFVIVKKRKKSYVTLHKDFRLCPLQCSWEERLTRNVSQLVPLQPAIAATEQNGSLHLAVNASGKSVVNGEQAQGQSCARVLYDEEPDASKPATTPSSPDTRVLSTFAQEAARNKNSPRQQFAVICYSEATNGSLDSSPRKRSGWGSVTNFGATCSKKAAADHSANQDSTTAASNGKRSSSRIAAMFTNPLEASK